MGAMLSATPDARADQTVAATVQQPRAFGHVLGDVLTQRVLLPGDGHTLRGLPPPSAGRVGVWLERRPPRIEEDAQGRSWMVLEYQVVNAAQTLTQIGLPALELRPADGAPLSVAAWPISVGPLTPRTAFRTGDLDTLQPDRIIVPPDAPAVRRRMIAMLALTLASVLAWAAWWSWRTRRDARRLPFARAWQTIRALRTADIDAHDAAWLHLHRAFDAAAGEVVHAASLHALFAHAPYLEAEKSRIEAFYANSQRRFFLRDAASPFDLRELARALHRAEQRQ
jgi:mxaA protein